MMTNIQIHQTINNKDRQPDMNSLQSGKLTKSDRPTHSQKKQKNYDSQKSITSSQARVCQMIFSNHSGSVIQRKQALINNYRMAI